MMGTLTVRENFHFSASLRLPSHMTRQQRKERVEKVIDELGLTKCADTKVTSLPFSLPLSLSLSPSFSRSLFHTSKLSYGNAAIYNYSICGLSKYPYLDDIQHRISMYVDWK